MDRTVMLVCFLSSLLLSLTSFSSSTPCADFQFPDLTDFVLTAREDSTVNLTFQIDNYTHCIAHSNFSLYASKIVQISEEQCSLLHRNGKCQDLEKSKCACGSKAGTYHLTHTVDHSDDGTVWLWSTDTDIVRNRNITFKVNYSAPANTGLAQHEENAVPVTYTTQLAATKVGIKVSESNTPASGTDTKDTAVTYIATVIAVVVIVAILSFSVSLTMCYVKRVVLNHELQVIRREEPEAAGEIQRPALPDIPEGDSRYSAESSQSHHTYNEVQDEEETSAPLRRFTRHCGAPLEDCEDYLHPALTPSDSTETETTTDDQQPYYQNC